MKLVELRSLYKTDRKQERYIRALQDRGSLKKYINKDGYMCYSEEELERYKRNARVGRPIKYKGDKVYE